MARYKTITQLMPSILDRLIDLEPDVSAEPLWWDSQGVNELKKSVQRDLEWLLNTRRFETQPDEGESEASTSILAYGLPDLSIAGSGDFERHEWLRASVETAVRSFEPRLVDAQVSLGESPAEGDRRLRLVIDGQLRLDPHPEPVRFDTLVRTVTGECEVKADS